MIRRSFSGGLGGGGLGGAGGARGVSGDGDFDDGEQPKINLNEREELQSWIIQQMENRGHDAKNALAWLDEIAEGDSKLNQQAKRTAKHIREWVAELDSQPDD